MQLWSLNGQADGHLFLQVNQHPAIDEDPQFDFLAVDVAKRAASYLVETPPIFDVSCRRMAFVHPGHGGGDRAEIETFEGLVAAKADVATQEFDEAAAADFPKKVG